MSDATRLFPLLDDAPTPVFYDLETGGTEILHPTIQIAASVWDVGITTELDSFERKLQFDEKACDPQALRLNSYDADTWKKEAVPPKDAFRAFFAWVDKEHRSLEMLSRKNKPFRVAWFGGHNCNRFDWPRVERAWKKLGKKGKSGTVFIPVSFDQIDTIEIARVARAVGVLDVENLKLGTLIEELEVDVPTDGEAQHDALYDARASALVCRELLWRLMPGGDSKRHETPTDDLGPTLFGKEESIV